LRNAGPTITEYLMPELTRRRSVDRHDCWHVYYGEGTAATLDQARAGFEAARLPGEADGGRLPKPRAVSV
jgi:hypothetical protein